MAITRREADEICKLIDESMQPFYMTPSAPIMMMTNSKANDLKKYIQEMAKRRKSS